MGTGANLTINTVSGTRWGPSKHLNKVLLAPRANPGVPRRAQDSTSLAWSHPQRGLCHPTHHEHVAPGAVLLHHVPGLAQATDLGSLAQSVEEPT